MSVIKSQLKPESHNNELSVRRQRPAAKSVRLLKFTSGSSHYAVEISELKKVISDLISIQASTSRTATTRFIKKNRGQTVVFNLESCLNIQQSTMKNEGKTSILIFNETISGFHVGVLVPGTLEILKSNCPRAESGAGSCDGNTLPIRDIIRIGKPGTSNTDESITLIDIRNLVENCIVRLKYWEAEGIAAQTA